MSTVPSRSFESNDLNLLEDELSIQGSASEFYYGSGAFGHTESWRYLYVKRALDFASAFVLASALVVPGLLIAVAVLLTSRGPVFYREERIGRNGRMFRIWKFRSMYKHAPQLRHVEHSSSPSKILEWRMRKDLKDPRITPLGSFLRRWSLDELPQLINVLRGEMSLIGPRPIVEQEATFYGKLLPHYIAVTPGMSGLWQVSGRSDIDYEKRAMLDAFYVETWNLRLDFEILLRTIPAVLSRSGAA